MVMDIPENCTDVQNALHLYVGSDLEAEAQDAVARHLDGCSGCRRLSDEAQLARTALLGLAEDAPLQSSVWGAVRAELVREGRLSVAPAPRRSQWWVVPAAAAASVAAVLLTLAWKDGPSPELTPYATPAGPQPVVLQPVQPGVAPLYDDSFRHGVSVHPSVSDVSAAGHQGRRVVVPVDPNEIIR